jgi:hypothetical protein
VIILVLLACGGAPPAPAPVDAPEAPAASGPAVTPGPSHDPSGALILRMRADTVQVGEMLVEGMPGPDPAGVVDVLVDTVRDAGVTDVILDAPPTARWLAVRQVAESVKEGGVNRIRWRLGDRTVGPTDLNARSSGSLAGVCRGERMQVTGVDHRYTLNLEASVEESWVRGSVRFRPIVDGAPMEGLDPACWSSFPCAGLLAGAESVAACDTARSTGDTGVRTVAIGGANGCLAPLWKGTRPTSWDVGGALAGLGATNHEVQLVPEARVTWDVVHATLVSLDETVGLPYVPLSLLQGNDGPPLCDAPVRSVSDLDRATGTWVGTQLAAADRP